MGEDQLSTPKKAKIRGAIEFLEYKGLPYCKQDVFEFFGAGKSAGYEILQQDDDDDNLRTRHNNRNKEETRGRKRKVDNADLDKIEDLYEKEGFEAERLKIEDIPSAAGLEDEPSVYTLRDRLKERDLYKRKAQVVEFIPFHQMERRKTFAELQLDQRPLYSDWEVVIFSDEVHFGYDDEQQAWIMRKPGTRDDPDHLQEKKSPDEEDRKKRHAWGAIGIGYKSPLVFYDIPSNKNGKMTQRVYKEEILEKHIKPLIESGRTFILEEDNDSGHGPHEKSQITKWKRDNGLLYYFNCPSSPDLAPIENSWGLLKSKMRKISLWDGNEIEEAACEAWDEIPQASIDALIYSMPDRLQQCIDRDGKKTSY